MLRETEHDAKMAFTLAKRKFKELKLTNITKSRMECAMSILIFWM